MRSPSELDLVIPVLASWGRGNPCAEADCAGPTEPARLRRLPWIEVTEVSTPLRSPSEGATVDADYTVSRVLRGDVQRGRLRLRTWDDDAQRVSQLLDDGYTVWVAIEEFSEGHPSASVIVAFDDDDRFAAVGYGAAMLTTAPLARAGVIAGADSGRAYIRSLARGTR